MPIFPRTPTAQFVEHWLGELLFAAYDIAEVVLAAAGVAVWVARFAPIFVSVPALPTPFST